MKTYWAVKRVRPYLYGPFIYRNAKHMRINELEGVSLNRVKKGKKRKKEDRKENKI